MTNPWNSSRSQGDRCASHQHPPAVQPRPQVQIGSSWRKKMDDVEARIRKEKGNLGVIDGEVKLKDKEKQYLEIKLQRLVREQDKLRKESALEHLQAVVAEQVAKIELLKSSGLDLERHGLEIVGEKAANGALKRKAEAARADADSRRVKKECPDLGSGLKLEPLLPTPETGPSSDSDIEYEDDEDEDEDADEDGDEEVGCRG